MRKVIIVERRLGRHRSLGRYHPKEAVIEIDQRLNPQLKLDTLIHELLHHEFPNATENTVNKAATRMAEVLWIQRYRRIEE